MSRRNPKRKAVDNTAVRAKRARGETSLADGLMWSQAGEPLQGLSPLILLTSDTLPGRTKVAGFDIDFTVISTASGRKFATGPTDWQFLYDCVPEKLKQLNADGFRVVFFTNQAGIEKHKVNVDHLKMKIEAIIAELSIPVFVFISTGNNHYRKPSTLMWDYMVDKCNQGVKVKKSECIYVGDAAGRAKDWAPGKPKDFSCSDRMFAANVGIEFKTPEEFFLSEAPAKFDWKSIDPKKFMETHRSQKDTNTYHSTKKEVIIMVGPPASGKSTFRKRHLEPHDYIAVNRDTMGTAEKCAKVAKESLKEGKSVVVDNTNPAKYARQPFIEIAKKSGAECRCFYMQTSLDMAHHLNMVRQNQTAGKLRRVPDVGYNVYKKNFEEPSLDEGFSSIVKIDFLPKFDNKRDEELFLQWT